MSQSDAGKSDTPRPRQISRAEYDLRWAYYEGKMTLEQFEKKLKKIEEKDDKRKR